MPPTNLLERPLVTSEPRVRVDLPLPLGTHRIELVVEDDEGNRSKPVVLRIMVVRRV